MHDEQLSRLLWEVRTRFDRQLLEEDAIGRYGRDAVEQAQMFALVEIDEGTHCGFERVMYLTPAGRRRAKAGRAMPFVRGTSRAAEWLRTAFSGVQAARPRQ